MFQAKWYVLAFAGFLLCSCIAPVLQKTVMEQGTRNPNIADLTRDPARYRGQLFVFGGIIASTTIVRDGSLIEAVYVPVDGAGNLQNVPAPSRRFLALYRDSIADPVIYRSGREITIAGTFIENRKGKFGEMEYTYPFFHIVEMYLWPIAPKVYYLEPPAYYHPGYPWYRPWY